MKASGCMWPHADRPNPTVGKKLHSHSFALRVLLPKTTLSQFGCRCQGGGLHSTSQCAAALSATLAAPPVFGDTIVRLPSPTPIRPTRLKSFAGSSAEAAKSVLQSSVLPLGSSYELSLQLLLDTVGVMLQQEINVSEEQMKSRLTNLE